MRKILAFSFLAVLGASCTKKCGGHGEVCTDELRIIPLGLKTTNDQVFRLDSSYTIRVSTGERIHPDQQLYSAGAVVLDDSYQRHLRNSEDNFRFVGWKGGQVVVDQTYRIGADACHIYKVSGVESVVVQ
jgi:hypothetical protein